MNKRTVPALQPKRSRQGAHGIPADLSAFIRSEEFPCVGAKSALALDLLTVFEAGDFLSDESDHDIHHALQRFGAEGAVRANGVASFACLFRPAPPMDEQVFENALWARAQSLHDIDAAAGFDWAGGVGQDPNAPDFSFSIAGAAYFVVGLHPGASRAARRFCRPALVFNAHEQFEQLRRDGRYGKMQTIIRGREIARHGSINPMLANFGRGREVAQYSGRRVGLDWTCPLKVRS